VSTFVIDHLSEDQLLELVQAWHLKNDDLKVAI
jgi:aspartate carbamoyltransferase regulatory subunit